jgi:hypothetical protein
LLRYEGLDWQSAAKSGQHASIEITISLPDYCTKRKEEDVGIIRDVELWRLQIETPESLREYDAKPVL